MRVVCAVVSLLGCVVSGQWARADQVKPCPPLEELPPCPETEAAEEESYEQHHDHPEARVVKALGATVLVIGYGIAIAYATTEAHNGAERAIDLLPGAGPVIATSRVDASSAWTSGLLFAAWAETVGVALIAIGASIKIPDSSVTLSVAPSSRSTGLTVIGRF
jgi:hypothetical protein